MGHKSDVMAGIAQQYNWKTQVVTNLEEFEKTGKVEDIVWTLFCLRSHPDDRKESVIVSWRGNLQIAASYSYGDHKLYPARKAPVINLLKGKPNDKKYVASEDDSEDTYVDTGYIPWESDESPAFDILIGVLDKTVTWNRKGEEVAHKVPKDSNLGKPHFKVKTTSAGKRVLEWANSYGFQACYLSDIIDVS